LLIFFFKKQGIDNGIFFEGQNGKKSSQKNSCFKETLHLDSWACVDICLYLATIGSSGDSQCFLFFLVKLHHFSKKKLEFFGIFFLSLVQI
jgi:hypothetical protein